jgi:uncharacterized protein YjbI with pentapeptide repeats
MNLGSVLHAIGEQIQQSAARSVPSKTVKTIGAALVAIAIIWALYRSPWSGFGSYINPKGEVQHYKTLWDWMQMLIVPLALAAFGTWFTHRRESLTREIEEARTREERLQNYFDRMTELMLDKGLRRSEPGAEARDIARARTLTVLRSLDGERKAALLRFLFEADLIAKDKSVIILSDADFRGANLAGADLRGADLDGADLDGADLRWADLGGANLDGADLGEAHLTGAHLGGAHLTRADLGGAHLDGAYLGEAHLGGANLTGAHLVGADLIRADLGGANLTKAHLTRAHLVGANLTRAHLGGADLGGAYLIWADLRGADLGGADLGGAYLGGVDGEGNLTGAHLVGANLSGAMRLTQIQVDSAKGSEDTKLPQGLIRPEHWAKPPTK